MAPRRLAMDNQRVEHAADVLDRDEIDQLDPAGPRVHRDVRRMGPVAEWFHPGVIEGPGHIDGLASRSRESRQSREIHA